MNNNIVIVYSKFSPNSQNLLKTIHGKMPYKTLCIDNKDVRKRILNDNKLNIQFVPCILVLYPQGVVEKYEGNVAFNWITEVLKNIQQIQPPPQPPLKEESILQNVPKNMNPQSTSNSEIIQEDGFAISSRRPMTSQDGNFGSKILENDIDGSDEISLDEKIIEKNKDKDTNNLMNKAKELEKQRENGEKISPNPVRNMD